MAMGGGVRELKAVKPLKLPRLNLTVRIKNEVENPQAWSRSM